MPYFFRNTLCHIKTMFSKWTMIQRFALAGIAAAVIAALAVVPSLHGLVPVINTPIMNEDERSRIIARINAEGIKVSVSSGGVISVSDEASARLARTILIQEDLVPNGTAPWSVFNKERWTITNWERDVNLRRAVTAMMTEHIKSISDIDDASVVIVQPERSLFAADQAPVTASVLITPKLGSDITKDRKKIEGIQKLLKFAVHDLKDENIIIIDRNGLVLNNFDDTEDALLLKGLVREPGEELRRAVREEIERHGASGRAITEYTQAIKLHLNNAAAEYFLRGEAYGAQGDYDRALADFTEVIKIVPEWRIPWYRRGLVYKAQGDREAARADFAKALELDPDDADAQKALAEL